MIPFIGISLSGLALIREFIREERNGDVASSGLLDIFKPTHVRHTSCINV